MWLAILVTIIASAGNNVGKALQKEATRQLPRFSIDRKILLQYARSRQYLIGLAADLGGAVLMIAAFALAPVNAGSAQILLNCWHANTLETGHTTLQILWQVCELCFMQVSLVQPVSGLGLAILSIFSHFYLKVGLVIFYSCTPI